MGDSEKGDPAWIDRLLAASQDLLAAYDRGQTGRGGKVPRPRRTPTNTRSRLRRLEGVFRRMIAALDDVRTGTDPARSKAIDGLTDGFAEGWIIAVCAFELQELLSGRSAEPADRVGKLTVPGFLGTLDLHAALTDSLDCLRAVQVDATVG